MGTRSLFLVNRGARNGEAQREQSLEQLRASGLEPIEATTKSPADISEAIRQHRDRVDLVIVGGGDGALNAAAEGLVDTGLPLGILPLGTANDLARTLGIAPDISQACKIIAEGHRKRIDLGWVNGKHFFNVASIGLTVQITRELSRETKSRWGVLAYPLTALRVLWKARPFRAEIWADGTTHHVKAVQIAVGNGRYYGGGLSIAEDAAIDDGWLDLYAAEVSHWWQVLALLPSLRTGAFNERTDVKNLRSREFKITTRRTRQATADGEIVSATPLHFRMVPRAVEVFVPREEKNQSPNTQ